MAYVPLVYFSFLFLYILRKKGFDVSAFVTLLYVITSFFSLLMFNLKLIDIKQSSPSLFSTIVYCSLITLSILPIYGFNTNNLKLKLTSKTEKAIRVLTYVFFANFIAFLIQRLSEIYRILVYGDFLALRQEIMGEEVGHVSGFSGFFIILINILSSISFVMIFVYFVTITYYKKSWKISLLAFLGTLPMVLGGIMTVNRSDVFYYILIFGICVVLFWRHVANREIKRFFIPVAVLFAGMITYFSVVTVDRFDNTQTEYGSVNNSLIEYAGMPYSNFCYFYDNYQNPDWMSTRYLFPVSNFIFNGYRAGTIREQEQSNRTGFNCVAFMTFLGSFVMDSNQIMPFVFIIIYLFLFRICRYHKKNNTVSFVWLLAVFLLITIPAVGCLSYFYTNPYKSAALYALFFFLPKK